jgi:hypothetical protein
MMQLVLSSSQGSGKTASLLAGAFQIPAQLVRAFIDPTTPAIQDHSGTRVSLSDAQPSTSDGMSGIGTPAGTGSSLLSI